MRNKNVHIIAPRTMSRAFELERVTLLTIVKIAQHMAESKTKRSPLVVELNSNLKPVEINVTPVMASNPAIAFLELIFSFKIIMARNAVNIIDVLERTEALEDVVNLCPKNWNMKPRVFKKPRRAIEPFLRIDNFLSEARAIKAAKKEAKANLIYKRSRGPENFNAYLIIGKEVLQRNEEIRIKITLSIFK